jgi:hypothetical protein
MFNLHRIAQLLWDAPSFHFNFFGAHQARSDLLLRIISQHNKTRGCEALIFT